jgi:hypothetical protein
MRYRCTVIKEWVYVFEADSAEEAKELAEQFHDDSIDDSDNTSCTAIPADTQKHEAR